MSSEGGRGSFVRSSNRPTHQEKMLWFRFAVDALWSEMLLPAGVWVSVLVSTLMNFSCVMGKVSNASPGSPSVGILASRLSRETR